MNVVRRACTTTPFSFSLSLSSRKGNNVYVFCELYLIFVYAILYSSVDFLFFRFLLVSWMSIFRFIIVGALFNFDKLFFVLLDFPFDWLIVLFNWPVLFDSNARYRRSCTLLFYSTSSRAAREKCEYKCRKCPLLQVKLIILINRRESKTINTLDSTPLTTTTMTKMIIDQWTITINCA